MMVYSNDMVSLTNALTSVSPAESYLLSPSLEKLECWTPSLAYYGCLNYVDRSNRAM